MSSIATLIQHFDDHSDCVRAGVRTRVYCAHRENIELIAVREYPTE